jgi:hypothetical protein
MILQTLPTLICMRTLGHTADSHIICQRDIDGRKSKTKQTKGTQQYFGLFKHCLLQLISFWSSALIVKYYT